MASDSGKPHHPSYPNLSRVPDLVRLEIKHRHFDPPRRVTERGVDRFVTEALEFECHVSAAFPIRALGPALWVGDVALTSAETEGLTYRFFAFESDRIEPNAPISLGWSSPSETRKQTKYRFTMPKR